MGVGCRIGGVVVLVFALGAAGCDDPEKRRLERQHDALIDQREKLSVQQAQLQIQILNELKGRPIESLSFEERSKVYPLGQLLNETNKMIRAVDGRIDDVDNDIRNLNK